MGSIIEINDTLQITKEQGFPQELKLEQHLETPYKLEDFEGKTFKFEDKPRIRFYHMPPVRVFLVENINGKWIYWGLCHILETSHNYTKNTTSGKYKIIYLNSPKEMKEAHHLIDQNPDTSYFRRLN